MWKPGILVVSLALVGCAGGPGMQMDESRLHVQATAGNQPERDYTVIPITADIVKQQQAKTRKVEATLNQNLVNQLNNYAYHIKPQDVLSITVFGFPDLTTPAGQYRSPEETGTLVGRDGTFFFPYAGTIPASGKTTDEVRAILTARLSRYLRNPQVGVRVASFRSQRINVVGEVKKPGVMQLTDVPLTVLEAINRAEGTTPDADLHNVILTRHGKTARLDLQNLNDKGDMSQNILLQDGDVVNVLDRNENKVFVLGEVKKPASYMMHKGQLSLAEALGSAEGMDANSANANKIYVIRGDMHNPTIYLLNGNSPDGILLASQFPLEPHDVVYVSSSGVSRWGRIMGNIIPSLGLIKP